MNLQVQRQVPASMRNRLLLQNILIFGAPVVLLFVLYGVRLAGFDVLSGGSDDEVSPYLYLAFAIVGTLICLPWCIIRFRKSLYLAQYGVEVVGRVTSISGIQKHGLMPMRYAYSFGTKNYTGATDITNDEANAYRQNPDVPLLVDPIHPERAMLRESVLARS